MKHSSYNRRELNLSLVSKLTIVGLYALAFYFAPVFSSTQKPDARVSGGEDNNILIALFNDNFEFGDY